MVNIIEIYKFLIIYLHIEMDFRSLVINKLSFLLGEIRKKYRAPCKSLRLNWKPLNVECVCVWHVFGIGF